MTEIQRPYFDIFEPVVMDKSCNWLQWRDYRDINANYSDSNEDFRIEVNDRDLYFLPHKSYLEFQFQLLQPNDAPFPPPLPGNPPANVSLQNNATGIMRRYEFNLDDKIVDYVDDADICNTVQNLVYYSNEYGTSIAQQQLWYPDTADNSNFDYTIVAGNSLFDQSENVNLGHRKRLQLLKNSRIFTVQIPLRNIFGLFKSFQEVTKGIKLGIRMVRNSFERLLFGSAGKIRFNAHGVKWWLPYVIPHSSILPSLNAKLNDSSNHMVSFLDSQIYRSAKTPYSGIAAVVNNQLFEVRVKRQRPVKVFVCFQSAARLEANDGSQCKRVFDNIGVRNMRVVLNATTQYPEREYNTVFSATNDDYARVYSELIRCGLKDHDIDQGGIIDYQNFKSLYPIFCFDLTEKPEFFVEPEKSLIQVFYTTDTATVHYCWVIVESEVTLNMSANGGQMKLTSITY